MNESRPKAEPQVFCRRLQHELSVSEHARCPYCFGREQEIAEGEHRAFCDFDPKKDPINFGFPDDSSRHLQG